MRVVGFAVARELSMVAASRSPGAADGRPQSDRVTCSSHNFARIALRASGTLHAPTAVEMRAAANVDTLLGMVSPADLRHVRPVKPVLFPASDPEWVMGQSVMHMLLCALLYQVLRGALGADHTVGHDQFIYFRATDPNRKCAPDGR